MWGSAIGNTFTVNGDVLTLTLVGIGDVIYNRMLGTVNPVVGSWLRGDITVPGVGHTITTILDDTTITSSRNCVEDGTAGFEFGTYTWDRGGTNSLAGSMLIDTNGVCGLNDINEGLSFSGWVITVSGDILTATIEGVIYNLTRHSN